MGAVLVVGLFVRGDDGVVPLIVAFLVGNDGLEAVDQAVNVAVGGAGVGSAEHGVTELAGQVGDGTHDEGVVSLLGAPVDQSLGNAPERVGGMLVNALDGSVVDVVVLVGVQGDFGKQGVPAGDVVLPPLGVDFVLRGEAGAFGGGVVHHGHGQEVQAELELLAVHVQVRKTGSGIFLDVSNGDVLAVLVVQGDVVLVLAVFLAGDQLGASGNVLGGAGFGSFGGFRSIGVIADVRRLGVSLGAGGVSSVLRLVGLLGILAADKQSGDHRESQNKS